MELIAIGHVEEGLSNPDFVDIYVTLLHIQLAIKENIDMIINVEVIPSCLCHMFSVWDSDRYCRDNISPKLNAGVRLSIVIWRFLHDRRFNYIDI